MSSSFSPTHPCRQHSKIHSLRFLIGKQMSFWSEHVRHPHPSEQSKRWLAVTFISPGVQFTIQTLRQTPSLHYSNVVSKTGRTYSPVKLFPPWTASHIPRCALPCTAWLKKSWAKADGGDAFVSLHLLLLLLREAPEAGEHLAGKCRRKTGEYSCQTVAVGAPGRLLTQMPTCHLHSLRSDELKTHSCILITVLCLRKASCNSVEVSVINLPHYFHLLWSSWCFSASTAQKCRLTRALPAEAGRGTVSTSTESGKEHTVTDD